jgi:hypothetical protein
MTMHKFIVKLPNAHGERDGTRMAAIAEQVFARCLMEAKPSFAKELLDIAKKDADKRGLENDLMPLAVQLGAEMALKVLGTRHREGTEIQVEFVEQQGWEDTLPNEIYAYYYGNKISFGSATFKGSVGTNGFPIGGGAIVVHRLDGEKDEWHLTADGWAVVPEDNEP